MIEKEDIMCCQIHRWIWNNYLCVYIRGVFLEYPRCEYNGSFEQFTHSEVDSKTMAREGLWMMTDLFFFFLLTMEPFSLQFPYIIGLLDFFFDTEYNAILM